MLDHPLYQRNSLDFGYLEVRSVTVFAFHRAILLPLLRCPLPPPHIRECPTSPAINDATASFFALLDGHTHKSDNTRGSHCGRLGMGAPQCALPLQRSDLVSHQSSPKQKLRILSHMSACHPGISASHISN